MLKRAAYKGYVWSWDGKVIRQEGTNKAYDPKAGEAWLELSETSKPLDDLGFKRLARVVWSNFALPSFMTIQVV